MAYRLNASSCDPLKKKKEEEISWKEEILCLPILHTLLELTIIAGCFHSFIILLLLLLDVGG